MNKKGIVFDISRCCTNDGPGIRTTVFLKGCPLKCVWCHNPESQNLKPEILYAEELCVNCGACSTVCPQVCHTMPNTHTFNRSLCIQCGACAEKCHTEALRLAGKEVSAESVIQEVLKDTDYYKESCGGLTVSGGEPLIQIEFLQELLSLAKLNSIHTCVETCGYAPLESFEKIACITDCFLYDFKESDSEKHTLFTGKSNDIILKNLAFLNSVNANIILRIPLIPNFNDSKENINGISEVANKYKSIKKIEILPYHPLGISKEKQLGRTLSENVPFVPDKAFLDNILITLQQTVNIPVKVII